MKSLSLLLTTCLLAAPAVAQSDPAPEAPKAKPAAERAAKTLSADELNAAKATYLVPSPADIFGALGKINADWGGQWRALKDSRPTQETFASDTQTGAALGLWAADAAVALKAEDKAAVEEAGQRLVALVKSLGAEKSQEDPSIDLTVTAEETARLVGAGDWSGVARSLETIRAQAVQILRENQDVPAAEAASLAGWLRGLQTVATLVEAHYTDAAASLLRQGELAAYLQAQAGRLPVPQAEALGQTISRIAPLLTVEQGQPVPKENLRQIQTLAREALRLLQS